TPPAPVNGEEELEPETPGLDAAAGGAGAGAAGGPGSTPGPGVTPLSTGRAAPSVTAEDAPPKRNRPRPPGTPEPGDFSATTTSSVPAEAPPTRVCGSAKRIETPAAASTSLRCPRPVAAGTGTPWPATTRPSGPKEKRVSPAEAP